jgi:hypothetical protein
LLMLALVVCTGFAFAGEKARDGRFIAYDNGTVLDTRTNLMWAAKDNGSDINWHNAKSYCENYRGGGYSDWRMPTPDELAGLYDGSITGENGYHLTNLIELTHQEGVWASDTFYATEGNTHGSVFVFRLGKWFWNLQSYPRNRALPVRSGK